MIDLAGNVLSALLIPNVDAGLAASLEPLRNHIIEVWELLLLTVMM